jgi:hypothetical protein
MSSWCQVVYDGDDDEDRALVRECLMRDDGKVLGGIMRFYACGPTYAWSQRGHRRVLAGGRGQAERLGVRRRGQARGRAGARGLDLERRDRRRGDAGDPLFGLWGPLRRGWRTPGGQDPFSA